MKKPIWSFGTLFLTGILLAGCAAAQPQRNVIHIGSGADSYAYDFTVDKLREERADVIALVKINTVSDASHKYDNVIESSTITADILEVFKGDTTKGPVSFGITGGYIPLPPQELEYDKKHRSQEELQKIYPNGVPETADNQYTLYAEDHCNFPEEGKIYLGYFHIIEGREYPYYVNNPPSYNMMLLEDGKLYPRTKEFMEKAYPEEDPAYKDAEPFLEEYRKKF